MTKDRILGRKITNYVENAEGFELFLDDGQSLKVTVKLETEEGADGGLYKYGVLRVNGNMVARV